LHDKGLIDTQQKGHYYNDPEEVSKMLSGLINSLK